MGKLQSALDWAARGFPVFPITPNGKEPAFEGETWNDISTTNPDTIRAMWTDPVLGSERDYNIGVDCTDRVVVDVDVKDGKDGYNQYAQLGGTYDTLVVQTPSGGFHLYYEGPDSANAPIANGVDIRSHHGYVLAPGSLIDGKCYKIINDTSPQWIPHAVERLLRAAYERREVDAIAIDSEASIVAATGFLQTAPVAVEGQRGDETTFVTAARLVREFALSIPKAFELLRDNWNTRCQPPWRLDELLQKVENAAAYGTADLGRLDPAIAFGSVVTLAPPTIFEQRGVSWGNALVATGIAPRPWIIHRLLMLHETTLLLAPGSAGKSAMALAIAAHLAMGKDFGPFKTYIQCKSVVYNGEDDIGEQSRRLLAVCIAYGFDYDYVRNQIMLLSSDDVDLRMVLQSNRQPQANETLIKQFVDICSDPDVGMAVYDPLVDIHEAEESDSPQMNKVMSIMRRVAKQANICSLIPHHTHKAGSAKQEDRVGNMDIARGASGIVYKARAAFTLLGASATDAEEYGFQEGERNQWVRLDDAKVQYTLAENNPIWFHKESVHIPSGDNVGVLKLTELTKNVDNLRIRVADVLMQHMVTNGTASMQMAQAVNLLREQEPLWGVKSPAEIRQRLEGMFHIPLEIRGKRIHVKRETDGDKSKILIVLT